VVFTVGHNLNIGVSGLMYLPVSLGAFTAVATVCIPVSIYVSSLIIAFLVRSFPQPKLRAQSQGMRTEPCTARV